MRTTDNRQEYSTINFFKEHNLDINELRSRKGIDDILETLHPVIKKALNDALENILNDNNSNEYDKLKHKLVQLAVIDAVRLQDYLEKLIKKHTPMIGTKKSFIKAETRKITPLIGDAIIKYIDKYKYENFYKIEEISILNEEQHLIKKIITKVFK